ncbi:hypothetical protein MtrunA17_Chr3g0137591 [Medicago truncatula]|uniref:SNRNP25 ubiquitin-like domain-containing protein n=1 Tax=Medicago truncatula TaxID=3880 RepID=A0A396IY31_MEDTR|nr:hypothetical protein MtrunA17_Chr3g0137591 [Medicago truncatula]
MSELTSVSNESPRRSLSIQLSSMIIVDCTLPYDKLPSQNLTLTVLKLDSSSFRNLPLLADFSSNSYSVEVAKTATVAVLKQAVEAAFRHKPEKISWPLVWGQFCLCYEGQKLVTETDYLRDYGIKDGDQVRDYSVNSSCLNFSAPGISVILISLSLQING